MIIVCTETFHMYFQMSEMSKRVNFPNIALIWDKAFVAGVLKMWVSVKEAAHGASSHVTHNTTIQHQIEITGESS